VNRDVELVAVETAIRQAIRDAVNRTSRKPFLWGGLRGYQQLEAIAQALQPVETGQPESAYLQSLLPPVKRVLEKNHLVAEDLKVAHQGLCQIALCLGYPPKPVPEPEQLNLDQQKRTSPQVAQDMETLISQFHPIGKLQQAQRSLLSALKKRWKLYAQELLYCYAIPGLPQDNLQLESLFGRLRRHQRRISGRKSTQELHDFGQAQVLFRAESEAELLKQIQHVPKAEYFAHRERLVQAEFNRQFFRRLHHDPLKTISSLLTHYTMRQNPVSTQSPPSFQETGLHIV
jgi:hypothetical protein